MHCGMFVGCSKPAAKDANGFRWQRFLNRHLERLLCSTNHGDCRYPSGKTFNYPQICGDSGVVMISRILSQVRYLQAGCRKW